MSDWDQIEDEIAAALAKMASQGSVPAANAALKLIAEGRAADSAKTASRRISAAKEDNEVSSLFGELGLGRAELSARLGVRALSDEQKIAHEKGSITRALEVRALQLELAKNGLRKFESWMLKK